jgi:aerotaxis receptor
METSFDMFIETEVPYGQEIISRTDLNGKITYINDTFAHISGYEPEELIGKPHSIVRHPDMPKSVFDILWKTISAGNIWKGHVKNMRKDKGYYWVLAEVSGVYKDGELVEYKSIREPVSREKRIQMQRFYDKIRADEENQSRVVIYVDNTKLNTLESLELDTDYTYSY